MVCCSARIVVLGRLCGYTQIRACQVPNAVAGMSCRIDMASTAAVCSGKGGLHMCIAKTACNDIIPGQKTPCAALGSCVYHLWRLYCAVE